MAAPPLEGVRWGVAGCRQTRGTGEEEGEGEREMPNWCFNQLMVTGPTEDVGRLLAVVDDRGNPDRALRTALSLRRIDPMPAELEQQTEKPKGEPVDDWYDWCIAHWGTKWDVVTDLIDDLDLGGTRTLTFVFDSAWSPPIQAIGTLAGRFPACELVLQFAESGCDFEGEYHWSRGDLQSRHEGRYSGRYDGGDWAEDEGDDPSHVEP